MYITCQERENKEKNQMTFNDNPITFRHHMLFHIKRDTTTHEWRRWKAVLATGWRLKHHLNDANATHLLAYFEHA